jgi:hypothetical protein
MKKETPVADVINDEKAVVDLDTARPRPALSDATNDELVRLLAERGPGRGPAAGR